MIKEIEGTNLIAVMVAPDGCNFRFGHLLYGRLNYPKDLFYDTEENMWKLGSVILPKGEYKILGEVTRDKIGFDVEPYVEKTTWHFPEDHIVYRNYTEPLEDENSVTGEWRQAWNKSFATKEESFYSRLAANGIYFVNPLDREKKAYLFKGSENSWGLDDLARWQSYEDKVVKGKLLIIQKIN